MTRSVQYRDFECIAEPGVFVRGTSVRLEFTYNGRLEKAWFKSLADVHAQTQFDAVIKAANAMSNSIRSLIACGTFSDDMYANMLPDSEFAKRRGGASSMSFGELCDKYVVAQEYKIRRGQIGANTMNNRRKYFNSSLLDPLPHSKNRGLQRTGLRRMRVSDIRQKTLSDLQDYLAHDAPREDGSEGYAPAYVNNVIDAIKQALNYAVTTLEIIDDNPGRNIKALKKKKRKSEDHIVFDIDEQERCYKACIDDNKPWLAEMFKFGCYMGMRKQEVIGLAWEDVNFDQRCIIVRRAYSEGVWKENKTSESKRIIGLIKPAYDALLRIREMTEHLPQLEFDVMREDEGGYIKENLTMVFQNFAEKKGQISGPRPWNTYSVRKAWDRVKKQSGVKKPFDKIRHTFSTWAMTKGIDIVHLAKHLGHSDITMLMTRYGDLRIEFDQDVIKKRNRQLGFDDF